RMYSEWSSDSLHSSSCRWPKHPRGPQHPPSARAATTTPDRAPRKPHLHEKPTSTSSKATTNAPARQPPAKAIGALLPPSPLPPPPLTRIGSRPLARAATAVRPPLRAFTCCAARHHHGALPKAVVPAAGATLTSRCGLTAAAAACRPVSPNVAAGFTATHRASSRASSTTAKTGTANSPSPSVLPEFSLSGKVVIVSGAGRGLGLVQTEALLEAGATVYALDRLADPSPDFARVQKKAVALGTRLEYARVDVRDVDVLKQVVDGIAEREGGIHGLIAAAGIQQETPAIEYAAEDANRMFEINVTGVFMTAQAVARHMIASGKGGSIVLIGSMSGTVANRGLICPAYNASKAAVLQLARNLASEWGMHNIRVNSLSPGYIVTQMVLELFESFPERKTDWPSQNMLGRLSSPEEYRGAAVFLLSDASSFMTGADLRMDGGHAAW
ncbi:hypothetical protein V498_10441, partial [Pseudogymnoascus sp. VKM F-4517 (FW-2822)]